MILTLLRLAGVGAELGMCVDVDAGVRVVGVRDPAERVSVGPGAVGPAGFEVEGARGWTAGVAVVALVPFA